MKNILRSKILSLLIIVLVLFAGCGKGNNTAEVMSRSTPSPAATGQSQQTPAANRYDEIFNPAKDSGKLVIRFLYTSTKTETKSGDSTIIKTPDGKVMLIDGSAPETVNTMTKYLDSLGIKKIDAIVASHPHIDHVGGLAEIIKKYDVGKVYRSKIDYPTATNKAFLKAIEDKKVETEILKDGMSFDFGEVKVNVYNPIDEIEYPKGYPDNNTAFLNDNSVVLKLTYKDSTVLMPGDLYLVGERSLLERHEKDIQADILKIPHHGADTSSSSPFRKAVQPKIAVAIYDQVASVNTYNSYRKDNAKTYITAVDGCVKVVADGTKDYQVVTEKDRISDFLK